MSGRDELRKVNAAKLQAEAAVEAALVEVAVVDGRLLELDGLETAAALGELDAGGLADERAACVSRRAAALEQLRRGQAVLAGVEPRIEAARVAVVCGDVEAIGEELDRLLPARVKVEEKLLGALKAADKYAGDLVRQRERQAELLREAERLAATVEEPVVLPVETDEQAWLPEGWADRDAPVVAAILAGPRTPLSDAAASAELRRQEAERRDDAQVRDAGRELALGGLVVFANVPERLHLAVRAEADRVRADAQRQFDETNAVNQAKYDRWRLGGVQADDDVDGGAESREGVQREIEPAAQS